MLGFYRALSHLEELVLDEEHLHCGFWWRAVFTQRIPNLARTGDLSRLCAQIGDASIPEPLA